MLACRHRASRLRAIVLGAVMVAAIACGCGGSRDLVWKFHLATPELQSRALFIEARILRGSCTGTDVVYRSEFRFPGSGPDAPALPPGRYFFSGRARDASCVWFAEGCVDSPCMGCPADGLTLPLPNAGPVDVALEMIPDTPACVAPMTCVCGQCGTTARTCPDGG